MHSIPERNAFRIRLLFGARGEKPRSHIKRTDWNCTKNTLAILGIEAPSPSRTWFTRKRLFGFVSLHQGLHRAGERERRRGGNGPSLGLPSFFLTTFAGHAQNKMSSLWYIWVYVSSLAQMLWCKSTDFKDPFVLETHPFRELVKSCITFRTFKLYRAFTV